MVGICMMAGECKQEASSSIFLRDRRNCIIKCLNKFKVIIFCYENWPEKAEENSLQQRERESTLLSSRKVMLFPFASSSLSFLNFLRSMISLSNSLDATSKEQKPREIWNSSEPAKYDATECNWIFCYWSCCLLSIKCTCNESACRHLLWENKKFEPPFTDPMSWCLPTLTL